MRNFICGTLFVTGIAVLGKSMYELGKIRGEKETVAKVKLVLAIVDGIKEVSKKEES